MRNSLRMVLAAASLGLVTSCYYDGYDSGYVGASYGFSGGSSTTFVHTSSSRWIYDPVVRCYFDYNRRAYYDPWLGGYYPRGYAPRPVYGVPHPYGWSGRGACPVPRNVTYRQIDRYQNRLALIQAKNYHWAAKARARQDINHSHFQSHRANQAANYYKNANRQAHRGGQARPPASTPNPRSVGRDDRQPDSATGFGQPQRGQRGTAVPQRGPTRPGFNQPVNSVGGRGSATSGRETARPAASRPTAVSRPPAVNRSRPAVSPPPPAPRPQPQPARQPANSRQAHAARINEKYGTGGQPPPRRGR